MTWLREIACSVTADLQTAFRQTVPMKAPVEAETSTIINKRLFFNKFHFELVYRSAYEYIQRKCI